MKNHYQIGKETVHKVSTHSLMEMPARIFHESAYGGPHGVGSEAYLNGASQGELVLSVAEGTPQDARKDGHIIRARCALLSPAGGFPVSWSQQAIGEISGLEVGLIKSQIEMRRNELVK